MSVHKTIRILVEDFDDEVLEDIEGRSALHGFSKKLGRQVLDISLDALQKKINGALKNTLSVLSNVTLDTEEFEVNQIRFTLNISSSGEVSLVSLAKGSLSEQAGIEFTIVRRKGKDTAD